MIISMKKLWMGLWCVMVGQVLYGQTLLHSRLSTNIEPAIYLNKNQSLAKVDGVGQTSFLSEHQVPKGKPFKSTNAFSPYFSFGISTGFVHYQGDVYSKFRVNTNLSYGASLFLHFMPYLRARASFAVGAISGNDSESPDLERQAQNLNFRNRIQELSLVAEWDFFPWLPEETPKVSGFIYAGFTFFKHNPQTFDDFSSSYLNLRDLTTEGQALPGYSLTSTAIPLGIGARYKFASHWTVSLRGGIRLALTDYLDDVGKGSYPSLDALPNSLSRRYANRTLEPHTSLGVLLGDRGRFVYTGTDGVNYSNLNGFEPGTKRGRVAGNDRYFIVQLTISTYFGKIPRLLPD